MLQHNMSIAVSMGTVQGTQPLAFVMKTATCVKTAAVILGIFAFKVTIICCPHEKLSLTY